LWTTALPRLEGALIAAGWVAHSLGYDKDEADNLPPEQRKILKHLLKTEQEQRNQEGG
jgi:hypothetical protein